MVYILYVELNKISYVLYQISYVLYQISYLGYKISYLLLCSDSRNDVSPVPQRNVSIAAERGAVRPSTKDII